MLTYRVKAQRTETLCTTNFNHWRSWRSLTPNSPCTRLELPRFITHAENFNHQQRRFIRRSAFTLDPTLGRESNSTIATRVSQRSLSRDELRKIGFHIRFHRSGALFARCWLLVEGETEVWLFNELARQCGYNLAAEGVQIVEFAQSGLNH